MTSAADISVAQVIAGQSPSDQLPETPPVTPDPYGLITPIDESVHVVKAIENLEPLPSAITTEASPVKVQGWTPINGKAILSNLPTPSSSSPSSDLTREDSPVIKDTSSATSSLVVSANSERNFQNETPSSRKRKADTQVTNDETARMTKRQRERSKGDKIIGEGCVATNPCTKCKNGGKTCKVPTNPKEMFTFKCGACIKGQMGCSLSARNPGRDDYDKAYVWQCAEKLAKSKKATQEQAIGTCSTSNPAEQANDRLVVAPREETCQARPNRTPLPTCRPKKFRMTS